MKPVTIPAETNALTLEEVLARLAAHDAVDGILLMGSTGTGNLTPTSDYDLLLVLAELPVPLRMVNTWVDGRLTEVYCTTVAALERIVSAPGPLSDASEAGAIVHWLQTGQVAYDRTGRLAGAQALTRAVPPPEVASARAIYDAWLTVGYNVAHARRYLLSVDPVAREAVDVRLLYSLMEVVGHYFTVRRVPWRGEKQALCFLMAHDPGYLDRLRHCLVETDRQRKVELYEELARLTFAPVGELWAEGTTAVRLGPGYGDAAPESPGSIEDALAFWQDLIAEDAGPEAPGPGQGQ